MLKRSRVEQKVEAIAGNMQGFTYVYEDWTKADMRIERMPLPALINLLPVSGEISIHNDRVKDSPNCSFAFVDKVRKDANGSDNDSVFECMKDAAIEFIARLNMSGEFEYIESFTYHVLLEKTSVVCTGIVIYITLKEVIGVCIPDV